MAHRRPPLVRALQLNTAVLIVEIAGGVASNSFSLIMNGVHNLSDEVALLDRLASAESPSVRCLGTFSLCRRWRRSSRCIIDEVDAREYKGNA